LDSSTSSRIGPDELVEGDIRSPDLDLGDPRLRRSDPLAELFLGEAARLALTPNGESEGQPQLDELTLFSGEPEKIRRLAHPPAGGGESLPFRALHGHGVMRELKPKSCFSLVGVKRRCFSLSASK
jgi:hypothetical protein